MDIIDVHDLRDEDIAAGEHDVRKLPVELTEAEVQEKQRETARLTLEMADAESRVEGEKERAKALVKEAEAKVSAIKEAARHLARQAGTREEYREVETREVTDRRVRKVFVVRMDTGTFVETRSATTEELESDCEWITSEDGKITRLTHVPTGDVVRERVTTAAERQLSLDALAPREIVWVSKGLWTHLNHDDVSDLEKPLEHAAPLKWVESGEWMTVHVPKGAVLDALQHHLGRLELPHKVGNDAPVTVGDLTGRKGATGDASVTSIKGRKRAAKAAGDVGPRF